MLLCVLSTQAVQVEQTICVWRMPKFSKKVGVLLLGQCTEAVHRLEAVFEICGNSTTWTPIIDSTEASRDYGLRTGIK